eukprot:608078-Prorocentrum_minimum.AAC.1
MSPQVPENPAAQTVPTITSRVSGRFESGNYKRTGAVRGERRCLVASGGGDAGAHTLSIGAACWRLTCVVFTYPFICVFAFNTAGGTQRAGRVGRREGVAERSGGGRRGQSRARSPEDRDVRGRRTRTDKAADEGTASAAGLKRTREEEQEAYRR